MHADPIYSPPALLVLARRRVPRRRTGFAFRHHATVGVQPDGSILNPVGQWLTPAGTHIEVDDRPLGMVLSPNHQVLAVVTGSNFGPASAASHRREHQDAEADHRHRQQLCRRRVQSVRRQDLRRRRPEQRRQAVLARRRRYIRGCRNHPDCGCGAERPLAEPGWHPPVRRLEPGEPGGGDQHHDVHHRSTRGCRHVSVYDGRVGGRLESVRHELGRQGARRPRISPTA